MGWRSRRRDGAEERGLAPTANDLFDGRFLEDLVSYIDEVFLTLEFFADIFTELAAYFVLDFITVLVLDFAAVARQSEKVAC